MTDHEVLERYRLRHSGPDRTLIICPVEGAHWSCPDNFLEIAWRLYQLAKETGATMGDIYKMVRYLALKDNDDLDQQIEDQKWADWDYLDLQRKPDDLVWLFHVLWRNRDALARSADYETDLAKREVILREVAKHDAIEERLFAKVEMLKARLQ
jgi:hypothetical protein